MRAPGFVAGFDSASAMTRSLARFLHGQDFRGLGSEPAWVEPAAIALGRILNAAPRRLQESIYSLSGRGEAIRPRKLRRANVERIAEWAASLYPPRRYPAVLVGSSNGALVHLAAALGIPWLSQTFLVPVARSGVHPDEPYQDMRWAQEPARSFLEANPDIVLHHMHDPNQDRLMIRRMTYFRFKRLVLGPAYERFLRERLEPGGTIFLAECDLRWPTTAVGERHLFQFGALGGASIEEYFNGGERVADYLARYGSHRRRWEPPAPDGWRPEAEWGFEPLLRCDVEQFAERHGYKVRRIVYHEPEHASPLVADLYAWRNRRRGIEARRLLVESFIVMEPYWALRTGSIPYWMFFNKRPSAELLGNYCEDREPFREIFMMLFSHGVESVGLEPISGWRALLDRATAKGAFVGVDERAYPRDFAVYPGYSAAVRRQVRARYPMPAPLTLADLDRFLVEHGERYPVQWL